MIEQNLSLNFEDREMAAFLLKFYFLAGELEGFNIIGKTFPPAQPAVGEARQAILAKLKAVFLSFRHEQAAQVMAVVLGTFSNLLEDLDQVEADPELLTMLQEGLGGIH
jgi:hypothetical protein